MKTLESRLAEPSQEIGAETRCQSCGSWHEANKLCEICAAILRMETLWAERKGVGRFIVASLAAEKELP